MKRQPAILLAVAGIGLAVLGAGARPGDASPASSAFESAYDNLKALEGTWDEKEYGRVVEYRLTGNGSALIEEFTGDPPMTSVYHMDGVDLRLTHYCNAGNQPRMIASRFTGDRLGFEFVDVTNLATADAYHTRTLDIEFVDDDHVILRFVGLKAGKRIATTHTLTRRH